MGKIELTKEVLVGAAEDLNTVLDLKPRIVTVLDESSFKGIALVNARRKFLAQIGKDLVETATGKTEDGKDLIEPTDALKPETIDVLEALKVDGIRARMGGGAASGKKKVVSKAKAPGGRKGGGGEGVNDWGHRLGSQSADIDTAVQKFLKGKRELKAADLAKETGLSVGRVNGHLKHLKDRKLI